MEEQPPRLEFAEHNYAEEAPPAQEQPLFAYPMMDEGEIKKEEVDDDDMRTHSPTPPDVPFLAASPSPHKADPAGRPPSLSPAFSPIQQGVGQAGANDDTVAQFAVGDIVMATYPKDGHDYRAKIISAYRVYGVVEYRVHYIGWPARYDHAIHRSNVHAVTPEQEQAFQRAEEEKKAKAAAAAAKAEAKKGSRPKNSNLDQPLAKRYKTGSSTRNARLSNERSHTPQTWSDANERATYTTDLSNSFSSDAQPTSTTPRRRGRPCKPKPTESAASLLSPPSSSSIVPPITIKLSSGVAVGTIARPPTAKPAQQPGLLAGAIARTSSAALSPAKATSSPSIVLPPSKNPLSGLATVARPSSAVLPPSGGVPPAAQQPDASSPEDSNDLSGLTVAPSSTAPSESSGCNTPTTLPRDQHKTSSSHTRRSFPWRDVDFHVIAQKCLGRLDSRQSIKWKYELVLAMEARVPESSTPSTPKTSSETGATDHQSSVSRHAADQQSSGHRGPTSGDTQKVQQQRTSSAHTHRYIAVRDVDFHKVAQECLAKLDSTAAIAFKFRIAEQMIRKLGEVVGEDALPEDLKAFIRD